MVEETNQKKKRKSLRKIKNRNKYMKNMRHERKRKAERQLMRKLGANSPAWKAHKEAIRLRVAKKEKAAHERALARKAEKAKQNEKK
jgi:heterodisulfide reductase subunit B